MFKNLKIIISIFSLVIFVNASEHYTLTQKDFANKTIFMDFKEYRILQFDKRIKKITFTTAGKLDAEFIDHNRPALTTLKVHAKKLGIENAIVTFYDLSTIAIYFNIGKNLQDIIALIGKNYPDINVSQANGAIVLEGKVRNISEKNNILDILKKSGIDTEKQVINLLKEEHSTKMVRVKLYVVQIDNNNGQQLINEWNMGYGNGRGETVTGGSFSHNDRLGDMDVTYEDATTTYEYVDYFQPSPNVYLPMGILDATSLTGGITAVAASMGSKFSVGLTLNYLKKNNAVRILKESTLIMQENKEAKFNTGGKFFVKIESLEDGAIVWTLKEIEYGLELAMNVNKIIDNRYVDFEAKAKSNVPDYTLAVDNIPGLKGNEVTTNVVVKDGTTVVLAGILSTDNSENKEKVPGLGDIPILGFLFQSSVTADAGSDLVFFLTPEIVDPMKNDETEMLNKKTDIIANRDYRKQSEIDVPQEVEMK